MTYKNRVSQLHLIEIGNKMIDALVDTGVARLCFDADLVAELGKKTHRVDGQLRAGNGVFLELQWN